jgi:hypothetical protein
MVTMMTATAPRPGSKQRTVRQFVPWQVTSLPKQVRRYYEEADGFDEATQIVETTNSTDDDGQTPLVFVEKIVPEDPTELLSDDKSLFDTWHYIETGGKNDKTGRPWRGWRLKEENAPADDGSNE